MFTEEKITRTANFKDVMNVMKISGMLEVFA